MDRAMRTLSCGQIESLRQRRSICTGSRWPVWCNLQNGSSRRLSHHSRKGARTFAICRAMSLSRGTQSSFPHIIIRTCEPAVVPQEAPILELLRWSAAISDPLRVVQIGVVVVALDFLPLGTWARALTLLLSVEGSPRSLLCCGIEDFEVVAD